MLARLPELAGRSVRISMLPALSVCRGKLLSREERGQQVHASSFIRERRIVLDTELLARPAEWVRILAHELFHFAWVRLPNRVRRSWESVLEAELRSCARGELGWSSDLRKSKLTAADREARTRRWREYACESFCDTAAWLYAGRARHGEYTLAEARRMKRKAWFRNLMAAGRIYI